MYLFLSPSISSSSMLIRIPVLSVYTLFDHIYSNIWSDRKRFWTPCCTSVFDDLHAHWVGFGHFRPELPDAALRASISGS